MRALLLPILGVMACGSSLPAPPQGPIPLAAYTEVPGPPPPAQLERVPKRPEKRAVWLDGSWDWTGSRWRWKDGGWYAAPAPGIVFSRWQTMRPGGTRLLFATSAWRDANGQTVAGPRLLASAAITPDSAAEADAAPPPQQGDVGGSQVATSPDAGDFPTTNDPGTLIDGGAL